MEKIEEIKQVIKWCMTLNKISFLRGIVCGWDGDENSIIVTYYSLPIINEEQKEELYCLGTEIISHFSSESIQENFVELPKSIPLPAKQEWAYLAADERAG